MRIGIDAHSLGTDAGGNETYMRNLLLALRRERTGLDLVAFVSRDLETDSTAAAGFPEYPLRMRSSYLRVPFELPWAAKKAKLDVLHVQYNAPPVCPCPFVVSMHDIVWRRFPEFLSPVTRYRMALLGPSTLRRAARVFVLTDAQKNDIAARCDVPEEKFDLVQPALDHRFMPCRDEAALAAVRAKYQLPEKYIAYVGSLQPRKNLARLFEAFARIRKEIPHRLVLIGKHAWKADAILAHAKRVGIVDRLILTDYASQADLPLLLNAADVFAFVSLYEGFGIPVLEALGCGVPVVASTDPSVVEVAGGAAVHVNPLEVDAIADGLMGVVGDDALRARLRLAGPERARHFTPARTAAAALAGYRRAYERGRE